MHALVKYILGNSKKGKINKIIKTKTILIKKGIGRGKERFKARESHESTNEQEASTDVRQSGREGNVSISRDGKDIQLAQDNHC